MIELLICIIIAVIVAACVLGVVKAILALPPFVSLAPYGGVLYALVVLLVVLVAISYCYPGHFRLP